MDVYRHLRPLMFGLDPERAHALTVRALSACPSLVRPFAPGVADSPVTAFGLDFRNPVGVAAGLDKNGECIEGLFALGFGFVEIGTVTPLPQPGNPKPRMFRLEAEEAVINRLGFNSKGLDYVCRRIERLSRRAGPLGINIGKNAATPIENAVDDYARGLARCYALADYITVNVSSPNTQGLRDLQAAEPLKRLVGQLIDDGQRLAGQHQRKTPILIKLAPDLDAKQLDAVASALNGSGIDGIIACNTTLSRPLSKTSAVVAEAGGLSGAPLRELAQQKFCELRERIEPIIPMIGVGGIDCGAAAKERFAAGAVLVQLYTGLVFHGPAVLREAVEAHRELNAIGP